MNSTYIINTVCLTFLQSILHDGSPFRHLQVAGWPEVGLNLLAGLFAWAQALHHPPEEPHLLLQQRHDLCILLPQQVWTERKRGRQWGKHFVLFEPNFPFFYFHSNTVNTFLSPLISLALVSSCLLSSSVSLGIPSSSSFSLSNQGQKHNKKQLKISKISQLIS